MKKTVLLLFGVAAWSVSFALTTITTGTLSSTIFCGGSTVNVPYTVDAPAKSGNVFTAQLSDDQGNFTNPVAIGSLNSKNSGTIIATIPTNTASGTKYKIRVVSSNPVVTGSSTTKFSITPKPTNLSTSNITSSSIKLSWNAVSIANSYDVRYSITGGAWSSNINTSSTNYTFTGLQSNNNYTLEVREKCGSSVKSKWASITANTLAAACDTPTNFHLDTISCTYATFAWNAASGASSYILWYQDQNGSKAKTVSISGSSTKYHLGGLMAADIYLAKIRTVCGAGDSSVYTIPQEWEENYEGCRVEADFVVNSTLKVYPNPSSGNFKLQYLAHQNDQAEIVIRNAVGQVVYHAMQTASEGLNEQLVSLNQKGLYIVQVKLPEKSFDASVDIE